MPLVWWFHCLKFFFTVNYRFDIMSECWKEDPGDRPTFSQLVTVISTRLEGMAEYVELNKHSKLV